MNPSHTVPALAVLPQIFHKLTDPRDPRGVRHPFAALCSLVFVGMLAQIVEMAVLVRWTKAHWDTLREPLGFEREEVPSATCISRTLAGLSLKEFRQHFAEWLLPLLENETFLVAAVDGKTCRQGLDGNGNPEVLLNVFLHDLKLAISQFSVGASKSNEPGCLLQNLEELLAHFPVLQLLTGDAIYLQRPLREVLRQHGLDYLFQVKDNQPDTVDALKVCFAEERLGTPEITVEKKTTTRLLENYGGTSTMRCISKKC
jgi:hypothetical protein